MEEMPILTKLANPLVYLETLSKDKGLEKSKNFVYEVLKYKPKSFATEFINTDLKDYFGLSNDELKTLNQFYKEQKVTFKDIGDYILKRIPIITLRDTQEVCYYKDGVYNVDKSQTRIKRHIRKVSDDFNYLANRAFVDETLAYIQAHSYVDRDKVDAGNYINFKNGLFNLNTWELEPHNPNYLSVRQIPLVYDPAADCPMIRKFLLEVVAPMDIPLIYEWFGLALIPETKFSKALMLYGKGSNGKTVLLNLLTVFIGEENVSGESLQMLETKSFSIANLYGKLMNIFPDLPDTKMHTTAIFKQLTGNDILIRGEEKYKSAFYFRNTARLIFSANELPKGNIDYAFSRRWILINFPNTFEENDDKGLIKKLTTEMELSGLLNLALEGLKRLQEKGKFSNSKSVEETQREYLLNADTVGMFLDECTYPPDENTEQGMMYVAYASWAKANKMKLLNENTFCKKMKEHRVEKFRFTERLGNKYIKEPKFVNISLEEECINKIKEVLKMMGTAQGAKCF